MRVLWTSNILFSELRQGKAMASGSWLEPLARALVGGNAGIDLAVVTVSNEATGGRVTKDDITYYVIPGSVLDTIRTPSSRLRAEFARIVADFRPDLIHVNGSEFNYGLLALDETPHIPSVLSIQGVASEVHECGRQVERGLSCWRFRSARDWFKSTSVGEGLHRGRAKVDTEIIQRFSHIIGRTMWDRAYIRAMNPSAKYLHVDEMLRACFWERCWGRRSVRKHKVFANSLRGPVKGTHVLIEAARLLKRDYPDLRVRFPGRVFSSPSRWSRWATASAYENYIAHLIHKYELQDNIECLGVLDGAAVAEELANTHVYAMSSFMENSSNSLAEAMLVGTPSIASFVGGLPSLMHDRLEGLLFPPGDAATLAECIRRLFEDDSLCEALSTRAREAARRRHDASRILDNLTAAYRATLNKPPMPPQAASIITCCHHSTP